jgi:hypothetical protein
MEAEEEIEPEGSEAHISEQVRELCKDNQCRWGCNEDAVDQDKEDSFRDLVDLITLLLGNLVVWILCIHMHNANKYTDV